MKWFISFLVLTLSVELGAQTTAISVIENPVISNLSEIQERMSARTAVEEYLFVNIDVNSLQNETSVNFQFFDLDLIINRDKLDRRSETNYTWYGISEDRTATAVLTVIDNSVTGMISNSSGNYRIETFGSTMVLERINQSKYPKEDCSNFNDTESTTPSNYKTEGDEPDPLDLPPNECKLRVLVMYTPQAQDAAGTNMEALAQQAVDEMNWSFSNSNIYREVELVYVEEIAYSESNDMEFDTKQFRDDNDGVMDVVHSLREQYAADVCVLIFDNKAHTNQYCGMAAALRSSSKNAFVSVSWDCATGYYSFAHEIGHLFGCQHAWADVTNQTLDNDAPHAHGYKDPNGGWRTLMSYTCSGSGCTRLPYWSNPTVYYNGQVMGSSSENNAQMIEDNFDRMMFLSPNGQSLTVTNNDVNGTWSKTIYAGGTMQTSGYVNIQWGRNYRFRAEESILMEAGFEVEGEAEFEAIVLACGEEGSGRLDYSELPDLLFKTKSGISDTPVSNIINLYPNPVLDDININNIPSGIKNCDLTIYSVDGKKQLSISGISSHNGALNPFNVSKLPKGVYYLELVSDGNNVSIYKFVKE